MNSFACLRMRDCKSETMSLFSFAIEDYKEKYGVDESEFNNDRIFGFVCDEGERYEDFVTIVNLITTIDDCRMIVIDVNNLAVVSPGLDCNDIDEFFKSEHPEYEELDNVYEDRLVYVKR